MWKWLITSLFLSFLPSNSFITFYSSRWWGSDFSRWDISRYGNCYAPLIWLLYLSLLHFLLLLSVLACVTFPACNSRLFQSSSLTCFFTPSQGLLWCHSFLLCYSVFSPWRWYIVHLKTCCRNPLLMIYHPVSFQMLLFWSLALSQIWLPHCWCFLAFYQYWSFCKFATLHTHLHTHTYSGNARRLFFSTSYRSHWLHSITLIDPLIPLIAHGQHSLSSPLISVSGAALKSAQTLLYCLVVLSRFQAFNKMFQPFVSSSMSSHIEEQIHICCCLSP